MGLLDDAIREHLELKRRHGADPSEVAKKENEVFGAARTPAELSSEVPPHEASAPAETDFATPGPVAPPPEPDAIPEPDVAPLQPSASEGGGAVSIDRFTADDDEPVEWSEPAPLREDRPGAAAAAPDAPEGEAGEEDVLEETPEFLQEAPEHDRLWFEQRPPRDFDF